MFASLFKYRGFILGSVKREFQSRYRTSMLGALWIILQPLAMILVYTLIFSQVMRAKLPGVDSAYGYSIYLCSGTLAWAFFSETISRSQNMFIDNANLLKKLNFPRICLPAIISLSSTINFIIIFSLFIVFLFASNSFPGLSILAMAPLLAIQLLFSMGLGLTIGVLNVFFRDIGQIMGILLQFWFWFTPIVYPTSIVPDWASPYIMLNPMARLIVAYQDIFVNKSFPNWDSLWPVATCALVFCCLGFYLLKKHSGDMVDEL